MTRNRRTLVLVDESARHPFRRSLPAHVRSSATAVVSARRIAGMDLDDVRSFLLAYCACFLAVTLFIS